MSAANLALPTVEGEEDAPNLLLTPLSAQAGNRPPAIKTHQGSCDAPLCDHEGEVLSCYDCGGEFCWHHSEQEHHNCKTLGDYFDGER